MWRRAAVASPCASGRCCPARKMQTFQGRNTVRMRVLTHRGRPVQCFRFQMFVSQDPELCQLQGPCAEIEWNIVGSRKRMSVCDDFRMARDSAKNQSGDLGCFDGTHVCVPRLRYIRHRSNHSGLHTHTGDSVKCLDVKFMDGPGDRDAEREVVEL